MLWRYAADFKTLTAKQLGVKLNRRAEGTGELESSPATWPSPAASLNRRAEGMGELEVYFDPTIPIEETMIVTASGS